MNIKFTGENGKTYDGFMWPLPTKNEDGSWTHGEWAEEIIGELVPCKNGYHYTDEDWCAAWIDKEMYEVEISGESIDHNDGTLKHVCRKARLLRKIEAWNDKTARLFAVRCARDAMKSVDDPDPRSVAAIDTAEKYANGQATDDELAAARDAAWAAAWAAAWDAARDAAWAAARDAALAAARAAALAAARAAARAAAFKTYSAWLMETVGEGK